MSKPRLLIANRGEIAIRIAQTAMEMGYTAVTVFSEDDQNALHRYRADESYALNGMGPSAYLDIEQLIGLAKTQKCNFIHPGYGFLSENATFAQQCEESGLDFIGPSVETLRLLGDKGAARELAQSNQVPIIEGKLTKNIDAVKAFFDQHQQPILIKAISGGGGRGMRLIEHAEDIDQAWLDCQSEAERAFGNGNLFVEQYLPQTRHIEIQVVGDGQGNVAALGERDCSLQRRYQKVIEIAPAPDMSSGLRQKLVDSAISLAKAVNYKSLGTFEFLIDGTLLDENASFYFIEANPRLQVEHTITEEIYGIDLVAIQLEIANGRSLSSINLPSQPLPNRQAMQLRLNMETVHANGLVEPSIGTVTAFQMPSGSGIRVDSHGFNGFKPSPRFDSLLAKIICVTHDIGLEKAVLKAKHTIQATVVEGLASNLSFLYGLLEIAELTEPNQLHTQFIDEHLEEIASHSKSVDQPFTPMESGPSDSKPDLMMPDGLTAVKTQMPGSIVSIAVQEGDEVYLGQPLAVIEAMKMESVIESTVNGIVRKINGVEGQILSSQFPLFFIEPSFENDTQYQEKEQTDLDAIRSDLQELLDRRAFLLDENRQEAVEKRHRKGQRTARENVKDLVDEGTFSEYGSAIVAAQRRRRSLDDLIERTPADGLVAGFGVINGSIFDDDTAQCLIMAYDYSVLAGTQGALNHKKMDRLLKLAYKAKRPLILFAEGGGGRPGDVDIMGVAQLDVMTFTLFAGLSGKIPLISIVSGYCFAGNAALAGCSDVIIATENASIGMGGPAMIEGGGLGQFHPKEVGPVSFQKTNGVIDILVKDEAEAVKVAKKYLSYFQGAVSDWSCADQRLLRQAIPENRRRMYDMRQLIETLADEDSVLEIRPLFGKGIITAFIRIEGQPIGLIANDPTHLGGAIDSDSANKAARFMQLCDAHGIPMLSLVDTPGIMVGPEAEATGTVRHASQLFLVGAKLQVPFFAVILRKGYGLGAQAMCAGSFHVPFFTVAWPTGEFGAMGLEGAVKLGFRKELEAAKDEAEKQALFEQMLAYVYKEGKAINTASFMELDEVIDPIETRSRIISGLKTANSSIL